MEGDKNTEEREREEKKNNGTQKFQKYYKVRLKSEYRQNPM